MANSKKHPPYDRSKAAGETEVRYAIENGLNAIIVNPTAIIGPFDFHPSHQGQMLISMARGKLPALVEGGFDWVDVRDVVFGTIQAEKLAPAGARYITWWQVGLTFRNSGDSRGGYRCPTTFFHLPPVAGERGCTHCHRSRSYARTASAVHPCVDTSCKFQ